MLGVIPITALGAALVLGQAGFDIQGVAPTGETTGGVSVFGAVVPRHLQYNLSTWFDVVHGAVRVQNDALDLPARDLVNWRADLRVLGQLGLFDRAAVGVEVPVALIHEGLENPFARQVVDFSGFGRLHLGDLAVFGKVTAFTARGPRPGLAGALRVRFPTGATAGLAGERGVLFEPVIVGDWFFGNHALAFNLGGRLRSLPMRLGTGQQVGSELTWALGARFLLNAPPHGSPQAVSLELLGGLPLWDFSGPISGTNVTANLALTQGIMVGRRSSFDIVVGAGVGLVRAPHTPLVRVFLGMGFTSDYPFLDSDGDGLTDHLDACPHQEEDFDGFEDSDGCPEDDNDGDGIDDIEDDCPLEPEDMDDIDDWDGCPDEDLKDPDADGIFGEADLCPDQAEDFDSFEDADGCPEPDNDGDGLPDLNDLCPDAAEDMNGFEDDDGCPDSGRGARLFALKGNEIRLFRPIVFTDDVTAVRSSSRRVVDQLSHLMRSHTEIRQLQIVVYPSNRAGRWRSIAALKGDILREALMIRGVEGSRVRVRVGGYSKERAGALELFVWAPNAPREPGTKATPSRGPKTKRKSR